MTTELIERLIRVLDKELLPTGSDFLSGRLGILVQDLTLGVTGSYFIAVISNDKLNLTAIRLLNLKCQLEKDPFKDMKVSLYVDEITELRDRHLRIARFQIFVKEKDKK